MKSEGVWIVTSFDWNAIPRFMSDNELEARRWADAQGYQLDVDFWPFGVEWHERKQEQPIE